MILNSIFFPLKQMIMLCLNTKVTVSGQLKILGGIPYFKIPKNGEVIFGDNVVLNSDFKKSNTALTFRCKFITGYNGKIIVGKNTMFNGVCVVSYDEVIIGDNCQIASSTMIADTNFHPVEPFQRELQVSGKPFSLESVKHEKIFIGNNVWIGWNCTILKGVEIGENSIVAAGSVVTSGKYPSNCIIAGNPSKVVKLI
ncbi:acyltransferase [Shewanella inventionis]|uniref:Acyltransferase n=1 Tax=Shewanella inventionis TaxID=1738770 RepID=A0ABQ1J7C6_9GAMM|nr:acyltransferase [Shewanella inventionis]MCL1159243.1 acyltransferase [Shewanella inventionis]GGB60482.1 hypothetical protein GCM10011607_21470 [Shewanella inventionis]